METPHFSTSNVYINALEWKKELCNEETKGKGSPHQYNQLNDKITPFLPEIEIVVKSAQNILELQENLQEQANKVPLDLGEVRSFKQLSSDIANLTESILSAREKKETLNPLIKMIARVLSFISGGIINSWEKNEKFEKEISQLKKMIDIIRRESQELQEKLQAAYKELIINDLKYKENILNQVLDLPEDDFISQLIDKAVQLKSEIKNLEKIENSQESDKSTLETARQQLEESKNELKLHIDNRQRLEAEIKRGLDGNKYEELRENFITAMPLIEQKTGDLQESVKGVFEEHLTQLVDSPEKKLLTTQFKKDYERVVNAFKRIDTQQNIHDKIPYPPRNDLENRVAKGLEALEELVQGHESNKDWMGILQLATTQTTLNAVIALPIGNLRRSGAETTWYENNIAYVLTTTFSVNESLSVILEINRDKDGAITSVNVSTQGNLDLVKKEEEEEDKENPDQGAMIIKRAVEAKLSYTIELDPKTRKPIIENMICSLAHHIPEFKPQPQIDDPKNRIYA